MPIVKQQVLVSKRSKALKLLTTKLAQNTALSKKAFIMMRTEKTNFNMCNVLINAKTVVKQHVM